MRRWEMEGGRWRVWVVVLMLVSRFWHWEVEGKSLPITGGSFKVLVTNGGVSAMHMFVTKANTVVYFDRTDYGPSQLKLPNGVCRNNPKDLKLKVDCTAHSGELTLSDNSIRALFLFSDTWCSSGAFSSNGTMIHTGGYNDGEKVVREFIPCADKKCDWIELPPAQAELTVKRWYASNQILPDGVTTIVVGGTGAYSYEFVPRPAGQSGFNFPFLRQTNTPGVQGNLYPFVFLMPDGNLFIFANNQSIAFNYKTNRVVRTYPELDSDGGGRNYPLTGSAVMLPLLYWENFTSAEVLVCGGAPAGSYQLANRKVFVEGLNTCGRLTITDPKATWRMEKLPTPWVMMDMVLLPTQEVLLVNGASVGVAGWGLADKPVLNPALYRTYIARGRRFKTLSATTIPRMYHSSAVLLPDTRVLLGGSNTHSGYVFTGTFPTELRLESYSPYYLDSAHVSLRPKIIKLSANTAGYGKNIFVQFALATAPKRSKFNVVIYAPPFATHSFSQGQRQLVLANTIPLPTTVAGRYQCTVTMPAKNVFAPPGFYMLFVVNAGVPSPAAWLQLA